YDPGQCDAAREWGFPVFLPEQHRAGRGGVCLNQPDELGSHWRGDAGLSRRLPVYGPGGYELPEAVLTVDGAITSDWSDWSDASDNGLLPDTKLAVDGIQQVLGRGFAHDFSHGIHRDAQVHGDQFQRGIGAQRVDRAQRSGAGAVQGVLVPGI